MVSELLFWGASAESELSGVEVTEVIHICFEGFFLALDFFSVEERECLASDGTLGLQVDYNSIF